MRGSARPADSGHHSETHAPVVTSARPAPSVVRQRSVTPRCRRDPPLDGYPTHRSSSQIQRSAQLVKCAVSVRRSPVLYH